MRPSRMVRALCACLFLGFGVFAWGEPLRDYYEEPGLNPFKGTAGSLNESIDLFSGTLQLFHTDIFVPGNGGMDIRVNRVYTSPQTRELPKRRISGAGFSWSMHFGRIVVPQDHADDVCIQSREGTVRDNPSLEFSDGGRQILARSALHDDYTLITKTNWIVRCIGGGQGFIATSPSGVSYTMDVVDTFNNERTWLTSRIEDLHGNWIRIDYESNSAGIRYISEVYRSEEGESAPVLRYYYENLDSAAIYLSRIEVLDGSLVLQEWLYEYTPINGDVLDDVAFQLTTVTRPDGRTWEYTYYDWAGSQQNGSSNPANPGSYGLRSVTYPEGGNVEYTYQYVSFDPFIRARKTTAISTKTQSGDDIVDGQWRYRFRPAHYAVQRAQSIPNCTLKLDTTTVERPDNVRETYRHFGLSFCHRTRRLPDGTFIDEYEHFPAHQVGLLKFTEVHQFSTMIHQSANQWAFREISRENYDHGVVGKSWLSNSVQVPMLAVATENYDSRATQSDHYLDDTNPSDGLQGRVGYFYATLYSEFDEYGNPGRVLEYDRLRSADQDQSRETRIAYENNTENWLIGLVTSEQTQTPGDTSSQVERSYTYNNLGLLESQTHYGVAQTFGYHANGALRSSTDALGRETRFEEYRRGSPQNEVFPDDTQISREIDAFGRVVSSTDQRGFTRRFEYDTLHRLTRIEFPIHADVNIRYDENGLNQRVLSRGDYRQIEIFDRLGQIKQREREDVRTSDRVVLDFRYDVLGRKIFESYPNSNQGTTFAYDALSRVVTTTHADGSRRTLAYDDIDTTLTDESNKIRRERFRGFGAPRKQELAQIRLGNSIYQYTDISRNVLGQITEVAQWSGNRDGVSSEPQTRSYVYDEHQWLSDIRHPETGPRSFDYDAIGNVTQEQVSGQALLRYHYDDMNRVTEKTLHDPGESVHYRYNAAGQLVSNRYGETEWTYGYDQNGNVTSEQLHITKSDFPREFRFEYHYDDVDNVALKRFPNGLELGYLPNAFGWPSQIGEFATQIHYHPTGAVSTYTLSNGQNVSVELDARLRTSRILSPTAMDLAYRYLPNNNVTNIADGLASQNSVTMTNYDGYDEHNQLNLSRGPWGYRSYTYTPHADIQKIELGSNRQRYEFAYDNSQRLVSIEHFRRSTKLKRHEYQYDILGNIKRKVIRPGSGVTDSTTTDHFYYRFDSASRMLTSSNNGETIKQFQYDGNNHITLETRKDLYARQYHVYSMDGELMLEEDFGRCETSNLIYLAGKLIAKEKYRPFNLEPGADEDGDGISNCIEYVAQLDMFDVTDASLDSDSDGLTNLEEAQAGTNIQNGDTDGDGLSDALELQSYNTSAVFADSDGDGASDADEIHVYFSDPLTVDSDGDGLSDYEEIIAGSDPVGAADGQADSDGDGYTNFQESLVGSSPFSAEDTPDALSLVWSVNLHVGSRSGLVVGDDGVVYVGGFENRIFALNPDGTLRWQSLQLPSAVAEIALVDGISLVATDIRGNLTEINPATGDTLWQLLSGSSATKTTKLALDHEATVFLLRNGELVAVNANGLEAWSLPGPFSDIKLGPDGTLLLRDESGIHRYDRNGLFLFTLSSCNCEFFPSTRGGVVVFDRGFILQVSENGAEKVLAEVDSDLLNNDIIVDATGNFVVPGSTQLSMISRIGRELWRDDAKAQKIYALSETGIVAKTRRNSSEYLTKYSVNGDKTADVFLQYPLDAVAVGADGTVYVTENGELQAYINTGGPVAASSWSSSEGGLNRANNACFIKHNIFNPQRDSDNDGLTDCLEVLAGMDIANADDAMSDIDGDGMSALEEVAIGTDPANEDSDSDGIADGEETAFFRSNPLSADSDGDGIEDGEERRLGLSLLDPDGYTDLDGDGYSNWQEFLADTPLDDAQSSPLSGDIILTRSVKNPDGEIHVLPNAMIQLPAADSRPAVAAHLNFSAAYVADGRYLIPNTGGGWISARDAHVVREDSDGRKSWAVNLGRDIVSLHMQSDSLIVAVSQNEDGPAIAHHITSDGQVLRSVELEFLATNVLVDSLGHIVMVGRNGHLARYSARLEKLWSTQFDSSVHDVALTPDANIVTVSYDKIRLHSRQGTRLWDHDNDQLFQQVRITNVNELVIISPTQIRKMSLEGDLLGSFSVTIFPGWDRLSDTLSATLLENGNIFMGSDFYAGVYDSTGQLAWSRDLSSEGQGRRYYRVAPDGTIISLHNGRLDVIANPIRATANHAWSDRDRDAMGSGHQCVSGGEFISVMADVDGDGIADCREYALGLNPHNSEDGLQDADQDGLSNAEEVSLGTLLFFADSDRDGIHDADEVLLHGSNPLSSDTDHDGLSDSEELAAELSLTEPLDFLMDSDGDGYSDRQEILAGTHFRDVNNAPPAGSLLQAQIISTVGVDADFATPPTAIGPDDTLYLCSGTELRAIAKNGTTTWQLPLRECFVAVSSTGLIYAVGEFQGRNEVLFIKPTGEIHSRFDAHTPLSLPALDAEGGFTIALRKTRLNWVYITRFSPFAPPKEEVITTWSTDFTNFVYDTFGELHYQQGYGNLAISPVGDEVWSGFTHITASNGKFNRLASERSHVRITDIEKKWQYPLPVPLHRNTPFKIINKTVINAVGDIFAIVPAGVVALSNDGREVWHRAGSYSAIALASNGVLYLVSDTSDYSASAYDYQLVALNTVDGSEIFSSPLPEIFIRDTSLNVHRDGSVIVSSRGHVMVMAGAYPPEAGPAWAYPSGSRTVTSNACDREGSFLSGDRDQDGDGGMDCREAQYGFDPRNSADGRLDDDADGLTNAEEVNLGLNPFEADTDFDGIQDAEEFDETLASPYLYDTDGDTLADGIEYASDYDMALPQYVEHVVDTDGDGFSDRQERIAGTSEHDSSVMPEAGSLMWQRRISAGDWINNILVDDEGRIAVRLPDSWHVLKPNGQVDHTGDIEHYDRDYQTSSLVTPDGSLLTSAFGGWGGSSGELTYFIVEPRIGSFYDATLFPERSFNNREWNSKVVASDASMVTNLKGRLQSWIRASNYKYQTDWRYDNGAAHYPTLAANETQIVYSTRDFIAVTDRAGVELWRHNFGARQLARRPVVDSDQIVYIARSDNLLEAIDLNSGAALWQHQGVANGISSLPVIDENRWVYWRSGDDLIAFNALGIEQWRVALPTSHGEFEIPNSPAISPNGNILVGSEQHLMAFSSDGQEVWRYSKTEDFGEASIEYWLPTVDRDGTVYVLEVVRERQGEAIVPEISIVAITDALQGTTARPVWASYAKDRKGNPNTLEIPLQTPTTWVEEGVADISIASESRAQRITEGDTVSLVADVVLADGTPASEGFPSWHSDIQGPLFDSLNFPIDLELTDYAGLKPGTHIITTGWGNNNLITSTTRTRVTVEAVHRNIPPHLSVLSPQNESVFSQGEPVRFSVLPYDYEDAHALPPIQWRSSQDGSLGVGEQLEVSNLSSGMHAIVAEVTDTGGARGAATASIFIGQNRIQFPTIEITDPTGVIDVTDNQFIGLSAIANDAQEGVLSANIQWSSDINGDLGIGSSISTLLSAGLHVIRATVTDTQGNTSVAEFTVFVRSSAVSDSTQWHSTSLEQALVAAGKQWGYTHARV